MPPIIGDSVTICCEAKILGNVRGDTNMIIGAKAVVVKDVEENIAKGEVLAKIIGSIKEKLDCKEELKKRF